MTLRVNDFAWTRARFGPPRLTKGTDLVGTSLVETGVVDPARYLDAVRALTQEHGATRYFAHRRESPEKLRALSQATGLEIVTPGPAAGADRPARSRRPDDRQLSVHRRPHAAVRPDRYRCHRGRMRYRPRLAHRVRLPAGPQFPRRGHRHRP